MAEFEQLYMRAGEVFTPGAPVNVRDLFAGRVPQFTRVMDAVSQRGFHAVLYGERGVGKTSLANIIAQTFQGLSGWIVARVTCDASDSYASIWRKALKDIQIAVSKPGLGFGASPSVEVARLDGYINGTPSPDDVRRLLSGVAASTRMLLVFDEFDRIQNRDATMAMADTIKAFSDHGLGATVLVIGVADSVDQLIEGHHSIERALVQITMPRMSSDEIREIIDKGLKALGMEMEVPATTQLVVLSQGLPYITHLLTLKAVRSALASKSKRVLLNDVDVGIRQALEDWQQSVKSAYADAIRSPQPGNIYKEVLLACALAQADDLGYFTASGVRDPLRSITGKPYDIPNFARHLKELSEDGRGQMLQRTGEKRRLRYRFSNPMLRPYITIRGVSEGLIDRKQLAKLT